MNKPALFSSVCLGVALSFVSNLAIAESKPSFNTQVIAQTSEEPQSSEDAINEFIETLDLTEDQKTQIIATITAYRPQIIETYQQLVVAANNLNQAIGPESSSNDIRIARDEVVYLNRKLSDLMFNELIGIRDELTVEQRGQINRKIRELASKQSSQQY